MMKIDNEGEEVVIRLSFRVKKSDYLRALKFCDCPKFLSMSNLKNHYKHDPLVFLSSLRILLWWIEITENPKKNQSVLMAAAKRKKK